jgi:N-acetylmuramoyl-L-alanine amidase
MGSNRVLRFAASAAVLAGVAVPIFVTPARALTVPVTLSRTVMATGDAGRTGFAFAPTHLAFSWTGDEGTGVRFRTSDGLGHSSSWIRVPEAHDMEHKDHHYSGVLTVDRPAAVQWEKVEPDGKSMGAVTVDYLNTVDGPRRTVIVPGGAEAAASSPDIVTRAEWGADESVKRTSGSCERKFYDVQQLFVHHTVGSNNDPHPKATMRSIYWFHVVRRGWCDIGYNFVVGSDGRLFEGRWARPYSPWEKHDAENAQGQAVSGAHVADFNSGSVGVSLMGNYSAVPLPSHMRSTLVNFLAWEADRHNLPPRGRHTYVNPETGLSRRLPYIAGHRDAGSTECPGNFVYQSLPGLREAVKKRMGAGKPSTVLTLSKPSNEATYGRSFNVSGRLETRGGVPVAGQKVVLHGREENAGWNRLGSAITGPDGAYSVAATADRNVKIAAEFKDTATHWGDESPVLALGVRPAVTLEARGGSEIDGTYYFPAGTESVRLAGLVEPAHPGKSVALTISRQLDDGSFQKVTKKSLPLSARSRFRYDFSEPEKSRLYRAVAVIHSHGDHAAGRGKVFFLVLDAPTGAG